MIKDTLIEEGGPAFTYFPSPWIPLMISQYCIVCFGVLNSITTSTVLPVTWHGPISKRINFVCVLFTIVYQSPRQHLIELRILLSNGLIMGTTLAYWVLILQSFLLTRVCCRSDVDCSVKFTLIEQPSMFQVGNNILRNLRFRIVLVPKSGGNECVLNMSKIFEQVSPNPVLSHYYFRIICQAAANVTFLRSSNLQKTDVVSFLRVEGPCRVSAKGLAAWGKVTDLRVLILTHGVSLHEEENQTESDLEGLFNVGSLALIGLSRPGLPRMLTSFVWPKMAEVQLTGMALTSIPEALKKTMPYLQSLELSHNRLTEPPDFPWCNTSLKLPRNLSRTALMNEHYSEGAIIDPILYRRFFRIDFNANFDVTKYQFTAGPLDRVSMRGNRIKAINPEIFDKITKLQIVDVGVNELTEIPERLFEKSKDLVKINFAKNRLQFLAGGTFRAARKLRGLDLSNNAIRTLQSGILNFLENLEEVNLADNYLKTIDAKALPLGSSSLKKLYLQRNKLRRVPMCALLARNLEKVDMSENAVNYASFLKTLDSLDSTSFVLAHSESASSLDEKHHRSLRRRTNKKIISLGKNKIRKFDVTGFSELRSAKFMLILETFVLNFDENPLKCDCKMRDLQLKLKNWTKSGGRINDNEFDSWKCYTPKTLRGEKVLSVSNEKLKCQTQYPKCPAPCECYRRSFGLPIFVDCRNRSLTELPDELPNGSVELRLEHNRITNLTLTESLQNVTLLHMSHNRLRHIEPSSFISRKLREIFLDSNQLATLPQDFQNLTLAKINLQNNFFECDCRNKWMKKWLQRIDPAVVGGAQSVSCSSGKNQGKPVISVKDGDFVCLDPSSPNAQKASVYVSVAYALVGVLTIFIVSGFIYRCRAEIKVLLFTRLNWHPFDRVDDSDPSKVYDAFVSYSGRDVEWVLHTLRDKLEGEDPPYKLCIHDRDFLVGAPISENIFDSVKTSRRMIMVLSNNFIESEWCMLEFRAAHQKVLKDRINYLIIVLFDDVDVKNLDDELKLYLRTNTYLSFSNKWFWERLRYALPQK